jgi:hypothetical protein
MYKREFRTDYERAFQASLRENLQGSTKSRVNEFGTEPHETDDAVNWYNEYRAAYVSSQLALIECAVELL